MLLPMIGTVRWPALINEMGGGWYMWLWRVRLYSENIYPEILQSNCARHHGIDWLKASFLGRKNLSEEEECLQSHVHDKESEYRFYDNLLPIVITCLFANLALYFFLFIKEYEESKGSKIHHLTVWSIDLREMMFFWVHTSCTVLCSSTALFLKPSFGTSRKLV